MAINSCNHVSGRGGGKKEGIPLGSAALGLYEELHPLSYFGNRLCLQTVKKSL